MESTLSLTFNDMILRVAEWLGVAEQDAVTTEPIIPTDAANLAICKRLVNDGYRRFVTSDAANKHHWQWLKPLITVTFAPDGVGCVNSEAYRYFAPDGFFGSLIGPWTYDAVGPRRRIDVCDEGRIRELRASATTTGDPWLVAHRPYNEAVMPSQKSRRWEIIFWPTPGTVYTVTARARLMPLRLVELTDKCIAGVQHDETILAAALYEAEMQRDDNPNGVQANRWRDALNRSIAVDRDSIPRQLGDYGPKGNGGAGRRLSNYFQVDTYNGVTV